MYYFFHCYGNMINTLKKLVKRLPIKLYAIPVVINESFKNLDNDLLQNDYIVVKQLFRSQRQVWRFRGMIFLVFFIISILQEY